MPNDPKSSPASPLAQIKAVNYSGIVICLAIIAVTVLVVYLTVTKTYHHLENKVMQQDHADAEYSGLVSAHPPQTYFPLPREQPNPKLDFTAVREREERELTTYGWVNRQTGVVRIPIERAMQLIAERGLPYSTNSTEMRVSDSFINLKHAQADEAVPGTNSSEPVK